MSETREQPKLLVTGPQPAHQQSNLAPDTKPHTPLTTKLNSESLMSLLQKKAKIFKIQRKKQGNEIFERYSRKEKSLGQLSKKFLEIFGKMRDEEVSLDSVTDRLGVERRRIYDIINILESLGVVFRRGKNHYYWIGLVAISRTITNVSFSCFFCSFWGFCLSVFLVCSFLDLNFKFLLMLIFWFFEIFSIFYWGGFGMIRSVAEAL